MRTKVAGQTVLLKDAFTVHPCTTTNSTAAYPLCRWYDYLFYGDSLGIWLLQNNLDMVPWLWTPFREETIAVPREMDAPPKGRSPVRKPDPLRINHSLVLGGGDYSKPKRPSFQAIGPPFRASAPVTDTGTPYGLTATPRFVLRVQPPSSNVLGTTMGFSTTPSQALPKASIPDDRVPPPSISSKCVP